MNCYDTFTGGGTGCGGDMCKLLLILCCCGCNICDVLPLLLLTRCCCNKGNAGE